jgi:hypothetical protein
VTANALHPGLVRTNLGSNHGWLGRLAFALVHLRHHSASISAEEGADTIVFLASSPAVEDVTGKYFVERQPIATSAATHDPAIARKLWQVSEELTGLSGAAACTSLLRHPREA